MPGPLRAISIVVLVLAVPGCMLDGAGQATDGSIDLDAASFPDAARSDGGRDAMPPDDAGSRDGGPSPEDAGPSPVDAGPIDGGPGPLDAGPPRRDAGPPDAGPRDAGPPPTCEELFPSMHLCTTLDDRCELFVMLMGAAGNSSCDALCRRQDSECVEAFVPNNPAGGKCTPNGSYGCDQTTEAHAICACARVHPPR